MKRFCLLSLYGILFVLGGCTDEQAIRLGPQDWNGFQFIVDVRPTPIRQGMNEFIVIASRDVYKPVVDLVVSMRVDEKAEWRQAIQDGYTGVYRRAIRVNNPETDVLAIHIKKTKKDSEESEEETILYFPLKQKSR